MFALVHLIKGRLLIGYFHEIQDNDSFYIQYHQSLLCALDHELSFLVYLCPCDHSRRAFRAVMTLHIKNSIDWFAD